MMLTLTAINICVFSAHKIIYGIKMLTSILPTNQLKNNHYFNQFSSTSLCTPVFIIQDHTLLLIICGVNFTSDCKYLSCKRALEIMLASKLAWLLWLSES